MKRAKALRAIEDSGILLVYPIKNERDPASLWYKLHPKSPMKWDWSEDADPRVVDLWHLRTELSASREVVYAKWYQGRATFFSRQVYTAMLKMAQTTSREMILAPPARALYELLLEDSPQTSKPLRAALSLEGKASEADFNRRLKALWNGLFTVGFGEIEDGAFPSLAVGATKLMFEDLWQDAMSLDEAEAREVFETVAPAGSAFAKFFHRTLKKSGVTGEGAGLGSETLVVPKRAARGARRGSVVPSS